MEEIENGLNTDGSFDYGILANAAAGFEDGGAGRFGGPPTKFKLYCQELPITPDSPFCAQNSSSKFCTFPFNLLPKVLGACPP
jgi:hypothetical protein